jgi:hypothetical protein
MNLNSNYTDKLSTIKNRINESLVQDDNSHYSSDKLRFLIDNGVKYNLEECISDKIVFRNSIYNKFKYLIISSICFGFIYLFFKMEINISILWVILIIALFSGIAILNIINFFENNFVFSVDPEGIFIKEKGLVKWKEILFLHFKTKYDGNGDLNGDYLVISLLNDSEIEIEVGNLVESVEHLGEILYLYLNKITKK